MGSLKLKLFSYPLIFFIIGILILFVKPVSADAATYYVTKSGNDGGNGSVSTPWLTLQKAEDTASTGDTVYAGSGTYVENNASTNGWNTSKGIHWIAQGEVIVRGTGASIRPLYVSGTGASIFEGFTIDAEGTRSYTTFFAAATQNKTFLNCTFKGSTVASMNMIGSNHTVSDSNIITTTGIGIDVGSFNNISIEDNTFTAIGTRVLRTGNTGGSLSFTNNTVNATSTVGMFVIAHNGTYTFTNNNITTTGTTAQIFAADNQAGTITFNNNNIQLNDQVTDPAIRVSTGTWQTTINNNIINSTHTSQNDEIIYIRNQTSPVIENNIIESLSTLSVPHINVQSTGTSGGSTSIKNNTLKSRSESGYVIAVGSEISNAGDSKLDGALIEGNTIYGAVYYNSSLTGIGTHSIFYGYNKNAVIRFNTVTGGGYGIVVKSGGLTWTSGGIFYNKFINSNSTGTVRIKGVKNLSLFNNTINSASNYANDYGVIVITENNVGETSTGTVLRNNIIAAGGNNALIVVDSGSQSGFTSNNNLLYRYAGNNIGTIGATGYTWSTWQVAGYDTAGINADPRFTNPSGYDFTLQSSSPAINTGVDLGFARDFADTSVPQGLAPDVGAYEYVSSNTPSSSQSNYSSSPAPACGSSIPQNSPQLFQINSTSNSATLYFTPAGNNTNLYVITYGYSAGDERFGVSFDYDKSDSAIKYMINDLEPNKKYFFKVRGGNGCMPGAWSNIIYATTQPQNNSTGIRIFTAWEQMRDVVIAWFK